MYITKLHCYAAPSHLIVQQLSRSLYGAYITSWDTNAYLFCLYGMNKQYSTPLSGVHNPTHRIYTKFKFASTTESRCFAVVILLIIGFFFFVMFSCSYDLGLHMIWVFIANINNDYNTSRAFNPASRIRLWVEAARWMWCWSAYIR